MKTCLQYSEVPPHSTESCSEPGEETEDGEEKYGSAEVQNGINGINGVIGLAVSFFVRGGVCSCCFIFK